MTRRLIGPFNRVEGDLEVKVDITDGQVSQAWVSSPLYRGFEHILRGKPPRDALVFAPRICGICSVSQSVAAARAIAAAQNVVPPPNGKLAIDLTLAVENIADHVTHFYMFFMPDFCRETYRGEAWFDEAVRRFKALKGEAASPFLVARAEFMHMLGILAGKWPHTLSVQPGGSTRSVEAQEIVRLLIVLASFRRFLERHVYGTRLEDFAALPGSEALQAWGRAGHCDLQAFWTISENLKLDQLGKADSPLMSYGSFGIFAAGHFEEDKVRPLQTGAMTEDVSHSWMKQDVPLHPFDGVTLPDIDHAPGYTWCKAPRVAGQIMQVGAFPRQVVDGQPLASALWRAEGTNVRTRIIGRFIEIARLIPAMEGWVRSLRAGEPFCETAAVPDHADGIGLVEAARGSLGHWLKIRDGEIRNYQIVAPTTWNFSPRDAGGQPGPLEQALVGAPVRKGEEDPVSVQHIVRSFDPCMVCTVH
jgi:hydrogenase large subunit